MEVLFPILPTENESANTPPVEYQPNPYGFIDEQLWLLEQDEEVFIEYQQAEQAEAQEAAACRERAQKEA